MHGPRRRCDRGVATAGVILGVGVLMLAFVGLSNYVVFQYGRGALRTAVEQAARSGSRASADVAACEQRGDEALDAVLGGSLRSGARVECTVVDGEVRAETTATFEGWLDIIPDWTVTVRATAQKEQGA